MSAARSFRHCDSVHCADGNERTRSSRDRYFNALTSEPLASCSFLPSLLSELLRQNANVYHFQDPELLPLGFVLKLIFRKRVIYDAYEDFPSMTANKRSIPRLMQPLAAEW